MYFHDDDNCHFCKSFSEVWREVVNSHGQSFKKIKLNVKSPENAAYVEKFNIKSWPTVIVYKNNTFRDLGLVSKLNPQELWDLIQKNL